MTLQKKIWILKLMKIGEIMIGEKIFLRAVEMEDIDTLYHYENDAAIWHLSDTVMPFSRFTIEQYVINATTQDIYSLKQLRLVICEKETKNIVGLIDLYDFNPTHRRAGVAIMIAVPYRQKTYATEALQLMKSYAFSTLQLHQLYCSILEDNKISMKLFLRAGFVETAIRKSWNCKDNEWLDEYFLQLISKKNS